MTKIPLVDLKGQYASIKTEVDAAIRGVIETTSFVGGPLVRSFEVAFATFCQTKHVVSCANGTDAIYIALRGLGIGAGDEVITVTNTFIATAEAISSTGAKPVFVDVRADTALMDATKLAAAITPRTKAIIAVQLYGQPADMDEINRIAAAHRLVVLEDAAQAHGARYKGRRVGTLATAATFSFYPGKNLGAYGDGGAIATSDDALAKRWAMICDHGRTEKYLHEIEGVNSRLDTLQAAVLSVKLARLDEWNAKRRNIANMYLERLAGFDELVLPVVAEGNEPVWHLFVVRHPRRDTLRERMENDGIGVGIHYPVPLHLQPAYKHLGHARGAFPIAEELADTCMSLPMFPELAEADVDRVVASLRKAL
jgi:dTDP-4-amino-4,6-dideoxygalactose transaminase